MWTEPFEPEQYVSLGPLLMTVDNRAHSVDLSQSRDGRRRSDRADPVLGPTAHGQASFSAQAAGAIPRQLAIQVAAPRPALEGEQGIDDRLEPIGSALALVKLDLGFDVAREIAERVMPGTSAKLHHLLRDASAKAIRQNVCASARWIDENCERKITVADAVHIAVMSRRSFSRHFKLEFGVTPFEYLIRARLDLVCKLLARTDLPVEKIARRCGVGTGHNLTRIFRKRLRSSPLEYRQRNRTP